MNSGTKSEFAEFCGVWTAEEAADFFLAIADLEQIGESHESLPLDAKKNQPREQ